MAARALVLPLLAAVASCDAMPVDVPAISMSPELADKIEAELAALSGVPVGGYDGDYPIHVNWIGGPPRWEPLQIAVEAAARKWAHIIAPTPTAPYTFQDDAECGADHYGRLTFDAGSTLSPGLHLYVSTADWGRDKPSWGLNHTYDFAGWAMECVPRFWGVTADGLFTRPVSSQYNPETNTVPAGIIGFPGEYWKSGLARDFLELTPRKAYVTALHQIGHVLGFGTSDSWWDRVETDRNVGRLSFTGPDTTWVASVYPAAYWTDSTAVRSLTHALEAQGVPYDGRMIPLLIRGFSTRTTGGVTDTTFHSPVHWDDCLTRAPGVYLQDKGWIVDITGEVMAGTHMVDPRITSATLAALQGFRAQPAAADYLHYGTNWRFNCARPNPEAATVSHSH